MIFVAIAFDSQTLLASPFDHKIDGIPKNADLWCNVISSLD
jgi:hypothetical protein